MSDPKEKREIQQSLARDKTAKIISGLFPLGGSIYETYRALVIPLHEKKAIEWRDDITRRLVKLEEAGKIELKELAEDEEFNAILTRAYFQTLQTHKESKKEAFRNIVLNIAVRKNHEELSKVIYLSILEQLNDLHIKLLTIFSSPYEIETENEGLKKFFTPPPQASAMEYLKKVEPEIFDKLIYYQISWDELHTKQLVKIRFSELNKVRYRYGQITEFGKEFLKFVREPAFDN